MGRNEEEEQEQEEQEEEEEDQEDWMCLFPTYSLVGTNASLKQRNVSTDVSFGDEFTAEDKKLLLSTVEDHRVG